MNTMRPFLLLFAGVWFAAGSNAELVRFVGGPRQAALIELYTSEGCSSCPLAESWLGSLVNDPGLWRDFVPVAFHVDYWNQLGWADSFARQEFTAREREYAAAWRSDSVYTPCFVCNGTEWRNVHRLPQAGREAGTMSVAYDGMVLRVQYSKRTPNLLVHAAILAGGILSRVAAGENAGETLHHEFIALALAEAPIDRPITLPIPRSPRGGRHALAVWVTQAGSLVPLQAVGGWLD